MERRAADSRNEGPMRTECERSERDRQKNLAPFVKVWTCRKTAGPRGNSERKRIVPRRNWRCARRRIFRPAKMIGAYSSDMTKDASRAGLIRQGVGKSPAICGDVAARRQPAEICGVGGGSLVFGGPDDTACEADDDAVESRLAVNSIDHDDLLTLHSQLRRRSIMGSE